jgi:hypothetical protein
VIVIGAESTLLRDGDRRAGVLVLLLVVALHLLVLVLLPNRVALRTPRTGSIAPIIVMLSPRAVDRASREQPSVRHRSTTLQANAVAKGRKAPATIRESERIAPTVTQAGAQEIEPPPSDAPLRLDDLTIRRAIDESRNGVDRLAHNSRRGIAIGQREEAALAQNIADASIPDCARPDALKRMPVRIGGLLDLPLLAYAALKGLCR